MPYPKVPFAQIVKLRLETEVLSLEPVAPQPLSLVTPMMERKLESDFQVEAEEQFQAIAELWLVLLLVVEEQISQS